MTTRTKKTSPTIEEVGRTRGAGGTGPSTAHLVGHDLRIAVPDGQDDDPAAQRAEDAAVLASPAFQARVQRARANRRAGRGILAADMDRYLAELEAREYSGSLRVRMPRHLHRELVHQAERDGVSLNTLIIALLERGIGAIVGATVASGSTP